MKNSTFHRLAASGLGLSLLLASCGTSQPSAVLPEGKPKPAATAQKPQIENGQVAGQLVVGLKDGHSAQEVAQKLGARVVEENSVLGAALLQLPAGQNVAKAARTLGQGGLVRYAEPNYLATKPTVTQGQGGMQAQALATDFYNDKEVGYQWFLRNMKVPDAWAHATGKGIRIGVADEDIDRHHPDLATNIAYPGYDAPEDKLITAETPHDGVGEHGTWVAGTSSAVGNNGIGGVGVAPDSKIVPLTITHTSEGASYWDSAVAFVWSVTGPDGKAPGSAGDTDTPAGHNGYVDIVNYSFGGDNYSQLLREGINFILEHKVVFVTSAGNTPTTGSGSAAWVPGVISVAASTPLDERTTFSNKGNHLSVAAPGENIWLTTTRHDPEDPNENNYAYVNGTSFAGPATAGAAALILQAAAEKAADGSVSKVNLTPAQVRHILEDTAYSPTGEYTYELGYGVVRADKAVEMAMNDAANKVEKGASVDMRFVAAENPKVGIPLVGVTLAGSDRRPGQLLYGQSSPGDFVYEAGQASFYEVDAGYYKLYAAGPRPVLTGITPGSSVQTIHLEPGEETTFGNKGGVFPLDVKLPADANEANNTAQTATPIAYGDVREAVMPLDDVDFYSFSAAAGETAFINTQTILGAPDLQISVLDSSGKVLATNSNFRDGLSDAALKFAVPASGSYFVKVENEGPGGAFNTYWLGLTRFQGEAAEQNEGGSVANDVISGVNFSKALPSQVGFAHSGSISPATDVDVYKLDLAAGQTLVADTLADKTGEPDLLLNLFDAAGKVVASNDDSTTQDSLLNYTASAAGTYYVAVASYGGGSEGHYTVSFMKN